MTTARPAPRERPPRVAQIIAAARALLEAEGREALTMRRLAQRLGIRAPSLYKHLPGKHAVEIALIEEGMAEMGEILHRVITQPRPDGQPGQPRQPRQPRQRGPADRADVMMRLLAAYRAEALAHPNMYRLATAGRLPREELAAGLEDWAGEPWFLAAGDPFVAQALWSFAHGMVILELDRRYPDGSDLDRTWRAGAESFARAPAAAAPAAAAPASTGPAAEENA